MTSPLHTRPTNIIEERPTRGKEGSYRKHETIDCDEFKGQAWTPRSRIVSRFAGAEIGSRIFTTDTIGCHPKTKAETAEKLFHIQAIACRSHATRFDLMRVSIRGILTKGTS